MLEKSRTHKLGVRKKVKHFFNISKTLAQCFGKKSSLFLQTSEQEFLLRKKVKSFFVAQKNHHLRILHPTDKLLRVDGVVAIDMRLSESLDCATITDP